MVRRGREAEARSAERGGQATSAPPQGGRLRPLSDGEAQEILRAARSILQKVGMADAPEALIEAACAQGGRLRADGRLCFSSTMIDAALARAPQEVTLPGFNPAQDLTIGGGRVHLGTGGAAVQVLDETGTQFRDSNLADLYHLMRIVQASPNIHYGLRPVVARDLSSAFDLDINTAFACLKACDKPIGISFSAPDHVAPIVALFDTALGAQGAFRERPFCLAVVVHVVPPLRFAEEGCQVLKASIEAGMIPQICSAGQAGATSPVTLAGALAQGLAETLAGLLLVDAMAPGHPCIYALMPFVSDLRTGAMSGGGGETAIASAAAAQLLALLGLPSTVSAGMTDAKIADMQAGYEKGYTVALSAQAGADMINLSVGMLGSIMVASPEVLALDNDLCGAILRSVRGIEVSPEALDIDMIEAVVTGEGHYLGQPQTLARMKSDYVYPRLADRQSVDDWVEAGSPSAWERAQARVRDILAAPPPDHLTAAAEARIRQHYPIHLPPDP